MNDAPTLWYPDTLWHLTKADVIAPMYLKAVIDVLTEFSRDPAIREGVDQLLLEESRTRNNPLDKHSPAA